MSVEQDSAPANVVRLEVADLALTGPVLERLVSGAAVHADISLDKMFDALTVVDALVSAAEMSLDGKPRKLELEINPGMLRLAFVDLESDQANRLVQAAHVPDVGNVVERLSGEIVESDGTDGKTLTVRLT
ncbi:MAG TPA: hypothetical protein VGO97_04630 [Solirubrobacterales bacterium]|jgi:hypothetical protein|nr:hypothetical protein [Solirubrobacterales bacterium]